MTGKVSTCLGGGYYNPPHSLAVVKYNSQTQLCPNKLNNVSLWHKVCKVMTVNGCKDTAGMSAEGGCKSAGRVSVGAARRGDQWGSACAHRGWVALLWAGRVVTTVCVCVCMVSAPSTPLPYLLGSGHVPVKGTTYLFSTALWYICDLILETNLLKLLVI